MNDDDLSMSLVNKAVTYKAKAGQKKSMMGHFKAYCEDIAPWAVRLSRKAKEEHLIGRHPFMLSDYYDDIKDKAAAVLLSGVVPLETDKLSLRTSRLRDIIGSSPYGFIKGTFRIKDYRTLKGIGCTCELLQKWCAALSETYLYADLSSESVADFICELKQNMRDLGVRLGYSREESFEEAVFWLYEGVFHVDGTIIPIPHTKAVNDFIRAYTPHSSILTQEDVAGLFGFDYPAMIWYAARGREWLYKTNYDGIYRMEHNLAVKMKRQTPMTSYERWRFRTTFLSKVRLD